MTPIVPGSVEELADVLREAGAKSRTVSVLGNNSKRQMGGPLLASDIAISTSGLKRILQYEPNDLTISVQAGMGLAELQKQLAAKGQMIALDPPLSREGTIGGTVASNLSGPMRRAYGTARDLIIGMTFVTLEGKIVTSGGMVVKNVAGLDMGKLMIGSFGTLAVIASINFRLYSRPPEMRTFLYAFNDAESALGKRTEIMRSALQPMAVDLVSPATALRLGFRGYVLAIRASGSESVMRRYQQDLEGSETLSGGEDKTFWRMLREFSADFLSRHPSGVVMRVSTTLSEIGKLLKVTSASATISRAASGVTYVHLPSWQGVPQIWQAAAEHGWIAVVELAPDEVRQSKDLWLSRDTENSESFAMMKKLKMMFDPSNLLNRKRLYGRI